MTPGHITPIDVSRGQYRDQHGTARNADGSVLREGNAMEPMQVLWSGAVSGRGQIRYVLHRGRHFWQEQQPSGEWCTTAGEPGYLLGEEAAG